MEEIQYTDGPTRYEVWELRDTGWDDWASTLDRFLAHAIRGIAAEYAGSTVEWLEVNFWQLTGRLIVYPSQEGPYGDPLAGVQFELTGQHLEVECQRVQDSIPEAEWEGAWEALAIAVWRRVGECLTVGESARELSVARLTHKLRAAGYDYQPGEGPFRLAESGASL